MSYKKVSILVIFLIAVSILYGQEEERVLVMKIGNKNLKEKIMPVSANKIYSAQKGKAVSFSEMVKEMAESRLIYVGETHNNLLMHDIQLKVIQALFKEDKNLIIGLEMFPVSFQEALNKWSLAILSPEEFIRESRWYENWNYNFGFYQNILDFAKQNKIPLYALNVPRSLIRKIRMKGWEVLSPDEREMIPQPDLSHQEHRDLIRTIFESSPTPHQMKGKGLDMAFEGLYRAQSAWDEVMAYNAVQIVDRENKKMVILAGSGHLLYNLGMNRRAFEKSQLLFKTLICVEVSKEQRSTEVSRSLADYVWGIEEEERPAFPSAGLQLKKLDGLENLVIESQPIESVARSADFKKGDVILFVDGKPFSDINELRMYLAQFGWSEEVKFRILRNGEEIEIALKFLPPEKREQGEKIKGIQTRENSGSLSPRVEFVFNCFHFKGNG